MNSTEQNLDAPIPYAALVRGAATYILLGHKNLAMEARVIAHLYTLDPEKVSADIDEIVQREHHKVGGVFEVK